MSARAVAPDVSDRSYADLLSLAGKTAVITGAARGMGLAIARRMGEAGAALLLGDRDADALAEAARQLRAGGGRVETAVHDVRDADGTDALAQRAVDELGGVDVWVNNAGVFPALDPVDVPMADFAAVLDVNVAGVQNGMRAAVRAMRAGGRGGVILNMASTAAFRGHGAYSASKWAVRGMTKGLAPVVGPDGIRIVAIAPSITETPGMADLRRLGGPEMNERIAGNTAKMPLGRVGVPDDVARLALFLAGDAAAFMTGVTVVVDGGALSVE